MYNLFSNEENFASKKARIILLVKTEFLRLEKKVIEIFVRKKNVCYFCRTKTTFIVEKLKYSLLGGNL